MTLAIGFARLGWDVALARNADEALEHLKHRQFDWALVDVRLPGMQGTELASHIRRASPATGVVLMTAYDPPSARRIADLGVQAVWEKPFSFERLGRLLTTSV
jgi:CheY-like chemotaxis protein